MFILGSDGSNPLMISGDCNKNLHTDTEGNQELQYIVKGCVLFVRQQDNNNNGTLMLYKVDCEIKGNFSHYNHLE